MQMLGGGMILCGCLGLGMWYRGQFLMRLHMTRELICLLDQCVSVRSVITDLHCRKDADRSADSGKTGWERSVTGYIGNTQRREEPVSWKSPERVFAGSWKRCR